MVEVIGHEGQQASALSYETLRITGVDGAVRRMKIFAEHWMVRVASILAIGRDNCEFQNM